MGGTSKQETTQQSQTNPWAPAQPLLQGILGQLQGNLSNTGLTSNENTALNQLTQNAQTAGQFAPAIKDYATTLLGGGGALNQTGNIQSGYDRYVSQTNPLASNTNYDPRNTPGFSDVLNTTISDITNATNGQFAAAGRDFSGANSQALGRGIMQGVAPIIQDQYNRNVANQQTAAGNLYNAGNTNAGLLAGLQQQYLANQGAGVGAASAANDAANAGANATLAAEAARRGIPVQNLGLLANIGIPIAGLGGQSSGTGTTTNQMSGVQQFMGITGGLSNLFGGGGGTTAGNIFKLFG
ncbi:tail fiber domain-containing protein [Bradyrhizobium lablabi]|uniref:tail fiber domain-containing protein n=1 Tax=Bradyrhizobium lablabi TaxID=722472 RepID=UPI001BA70B82|nr:tail fiber domain-containing protein [Bradyrhizobium lablabi]MBR1122104.1 tail fiber domain-containing protein [Bradyrhizobium lablabi]